VKAQRKRNKERKEERREGENAPVEDREGHKNATTNASTND
jgi:hypothetical protein